MWSAWMLAGMAVKGTAVLGVAWVASLAMRRNSAAARHMVWTAAAAALLAMPWMSLGLPSWRPALVDRIASRNTGLVFRTVTTGATDAMTAARSISAERTPQTATGRIDWVSIVAVIWATGAGTMLFQMLVAYAALWRKRRSAAPFRDAGLGARLASELTISQIIPVLEAEAGSMPMNFGVARPVVFLPADATQWTVERLRVVLLHELAHVRRGDVGSHLLARTALALHWWNPVAWLAWREFLKERERATDDLVLSAGARASEYAGHLLEVARSFRSGPATAWAAVAMARGSQLEGRLLAILDSRVRRGQPSRLAPLAVGALGVLLAAPFAALDAQDKPRTTAPPEIDATIRAANAQKNHELLDRAASAYEALYKFDVAETLLQNALTIRGEVSGQRSTAYAVGLIRLADVMEKRGQGKEALELYNRAIELGDRAETAPALYKVGLSKYPKEADAARDLMQRAVNADPKGPKAGPAMTWLAVISQAQPGGASEAESLFQRALMVESPDSLEAATTMELYANFLRLQGRPVESEPLLAKARTIRGVRPSRGQAAEMPNPRTTADPPQGVPSPTGALRVGNGVTAPRLLKKAEPVYTEEARAAKWQGTVLLYVEIQPDGTAANIQVTRGVGLGLDEKAVEAVRQWLFSPGTKDGTPVAVQANIEVNFRLM